MSEPTTNVPLRPTQEIALSEVTTLLESIADSLGAIESKQEKLEEMIGGIKDDTEEILNNLDNISFKADYPGLED